MFDVASSEVILLGVVALLVIPPKDLPKAMRIAGQWVGRVRGVANQFRSGFDNMVREAELQEMEKKWAAENARIMREHPPEPVQMLPKADTPAALPHDAHDEDAPPVMVEPPNVHGAPPVALPGDAEPKAHP
jgi:sec-independent protein translocase protein TatB